MKKPVIRILFDYYGAYFNCEFANNICNRQVNGMPNILHVLNIYYLCEKDENGQYMQRDNIKPIFDL